MIYPKLGRDKDGRFVDFRWKRVGERGFAMAAAPISWSSFKRFLKYPVHYFIRSLTKTNKK